MDSATLVPAPVASLVSGGPPASGLAPTSGFSAVLPSALPSGCSYRCGDCGYINTLKLQDAIRCRHCGFRVLYKIRTNRMVQFEAR